MDKFLKFFGKKENTIIKKKEVDLRNVVEVNYNENEIEDENNIKFQNSDVHNENNNLNQNLQNTKNIDDNINNENINSQQPIYINFNEVVIVNSAENILKKNEGFYYKKYIDKINLLHIFNPILVERENMKVNFDSEVMDYLVNDLTMIFREKQSLIDDSQKNILKEIFETKNLVSSLCDIQNDSTFNYNIDFNKKQKKFMSEADYLEVIVDTLNNEMDNLSNILDEVEIKIDQIKSSNESNINE